MRDKVKSSSTSVKHRSDMATSITAFKPLYPTPSEEELFKDLEKYRQIAFKLGAFDAIIFPASEFPQDIRIWWKCQLPRCPVSGTNPYCPPVWRTPWQDAKRIKDSYKYVIIFRVNREPDRYTGPRVLTMEFNAVAAKYLPKEEREKAITELNDYLAYLEEYRKRPKEERSIGTATIGPRIVEQARKDGHQFAVTFGVGSCIFSRCIKHGATCVAMRTGLCRYPTKVSPEGSAALYQDFTALSEKMGWHSEVAGYCIRPEDAKESEYFQCGTVFIA